MKKFKRFLAAITTVAVSAVSFCSMFTASANAGRETFRIYVDVPTNSGVSDVCLNLRYDPDVTDVCRFYKGMLNNSYSFNIIMNGGEYCGIDAYYSATSNLNAAGTLGVIAMTAPNNIDSIFDLVDLNFEYICNSAGIDLPTSRIRINDVISADATLLNNYLNGKASLSGNALRAADTTADFGVTKDDLTHLNNYLNGTVRYFDA